VDLGDCATNSGFPAGCGNLILNDPTCPLKGQNFRQILGICQTALGGGNISSYGCTISNLNVVCSNLNQSFKGLVPSSWCRGHVVPPSITNVPPSISGYPTAVSACGDTNVTVTYSDVITAGTLTNSYSIARTWVAVDACGNSNYCTQHITVASPQAKVCISGPFFGFLGQTCNYTCCVTNVGNVCFTNCQVTVCGNTYTCPRLNPGQGCSFTAPHTCQTSDVGNFQCQANASCNYSGAGTPCTTQASCNTLVFNWGKW
jgi:hypothetical protein